MEVTFSLHSRLAGTSFNIQRSIKSLKYKHLVKVEELLQCTVTSTCSLPNDHNTMSSGDVTNISILLRYEHNIGKCGFHQCINVTLWFSFSVSLIFVYTCLVVSIIFALFCLCSLTYWLKSKWHLLYLIQTFTWMCFAQNGLSYALMELKTKPPSPPSWNLFGSAHYRCWKQQQRGQTRWRSALY